MAGYTLQVRLNGYTNKFKPYASVASAAHTAKRNDRVYAGFTFRANQTSYIKPYVAIGGTSAWTAPWAYHASPYVYAGFTFRANQSSFIKPWTSVASAAHTMFQPLGIYEKLYRPLVNIVSDTQYMSQDVRLTGKTSIMLAAQIPTEVYVDADAPDEVVDTLKTIVWWGGAYDTDYIYVEYAGEDNYWRDALESQVWAVAENGALTVRPSFTWDAVTDPDDQPITYELIIAYDFGLENLALEKDGIPGTQTRCQLAEHEALDVDQVYFWAVRARDSAGDCSEWSLPRSFKTFQYMPPEVKPVGGINRMLTPYKNFKLDWNVGNLPNGEYQYAVHRVGYDSIGGLVYRETIIPRDTRRFVIQHGSDNPPEIMNIVYDPQNYRLKFDVRLNDSLFRLYDLVSVSFADQKDKVTDPTAIYYMDSYTWKNIALMELMGRRKELTSNPYLSHAATLSWAFQETIQDGKDYSFQVKVLSEPDEYTKSFRWAFRAWDAAEGGAPTTSGWQSRPFDFADQRQYVQPAWAHFEQATYSQPYYGKAAVSGIAMNKTYFDWLWSKNDQVLSWDFALFAADDTNCATPLLLQEGLTQPAAVVAPAQFFDLNLTNVLLELEGIEDHYYELRVQEVDKIISAMRNKDFYWKVRAGDGVDFSNWSVAEKSKDFNIHHFEWDVRGRLEDFKNTNYLVLKVEVKPSVTPRQFEFPFFHWLNIANPQIEQYCGQIVKLQQRRAQVQPYLYPYYDGYINYLKGRIMDARNCVLQGLIDQGYFSDSTGVQDFIARNLTSGPVTTLDQYGNAVYLSELDIHDDWKERVSDLHVPNGEGKYDWSQAFYTWRMDIAGKNYGSQKGRPLRQYDKVGWACENNAYDKCYLVTGDEHSCPWIGRADLGFCPGFTMYLQVQGLSNNSLALPGIAGAVPDPEVNPQGFADWLASYSHNGMQLGGVLNELARNDPNTAVRVRGFQFEPGQCPMAKGANPNTGKGGPCKRYKQVDNNWSQHYCDVCGSERQPQFIGMDADPTANATHDTYSDINPAGFAHVEIYSGDAQVSKWEPLVRTGQSRNPQQRFTGIKLRRTQLPGEHNGDILTETTGVANAYFHQPLGNHVTIVAAPGSYPGNWRPVAQGNSSASQIIERV